MQSHKLTTVAVLLGLAACAGPQPQRYSDAANPQLLPRQQLANSWYRAGAAEVAKKLAAEPAPYARNVIFFLGDGMGVSTVTAARIYAGQLRGLQGEEYRLSFEQFPYTGLVRTYNVNAQTPDSAGTMSALMTGVKTNISVFGVDENVILGDCASMRGNELVGALELAELGGRATGVVSTARITHATPGATYAKVASRDWEDDSLMPAAALEAGCTDIAQQLINFEANLMRRYPDARTDGIEVALGGGRRHFLPAVEVAEGATPPPGAGQRADGRNLVDEWLAAHPQGTYVATRAALAAAPSHGPLLGLFNDSHMRYELDRPDTEPSLTEMTMAAIDRLENDPDGFFLVVEAGRIDHAHHAGNAANALHETREFAAAVAAARERVDTRETLIIVTADHSHTFTIGGYPKRGNPILGKVIFPGSDTPALALDELPYTTLGYHNGQGFNDRGAATDADEAYNDDFVAGRVDLSDVDTTQPGFHQEALVPLSSETHGGEDVAVYAIGPGARAVSGSIEQSVIFHVMNAAAQLSADAGKQR